MHLNDTQLNERIGRFIERKTEQFPELRYIEASERGTTAKSARSRIAAPFTINHNLSGWHVSSLTR